MLTNRPKPKWGHRSKGMFEDLGKVHYDEKQASDLAGLLGEGICQIELKRKLDIAANQYFWMRSSYEDGPTHAESKEALKYLQKHAQSLLSGLKKLDDKAWNIVLGPELEASYRLGFEDKVMTSLGYEIEGERHPDGSLTYETLGPENFVGAAEFVEFYISHALENYPKRQPGKMRLLSLSGWLNHIEPLWCECSGREFTLNFHKGEAISDAARFCKAAIAVIDPKVTDANMITAMREKIKGK